jgi:hypothetical protein
MYLIEKKYPEFEFYQANKKTFTSDIAKATLYQNEEQAQLVQSTIFFIETKLSQQKDYEFARWITNDIESGTFDFITDFHDFDQQIENANNGKVDWQEWDCYTIDKILDTLGLFDGLDVERDNEHSCCYFYFGNEKDAIRFAERLKKAIWPKHWLKQV